LVHDAGAQSVAVNYHSVRRVFIAKLNNTLCYLHGIEAAVFAEDLELASLAHADNGLVFTEAGNVAGHDDGQLFKALRPGAARPGYEIGWN
jgi:hypothetical protein